MSVTDDQKGKANEKDKNVTEGEVASAGMIRPEMVDAAQRFMMMPKIRQTPLIQQKQFLLQKGLQEDEINEAMKGLSVQKEPLVGSSEN